LKTGKSLYVVVTAIVAFSLAVGIFAISQYVRSDTGTISGIVPVCCIVVGVAVVWLGWYLLSLVRHITSITRELGKDGISRIKCGNNAFFKELSGAFDGALKRYVADNSGLEQQINELRIQIQLSQRRERNTEAIIYGIRDAVIVIDEYDRLLMANEAAGRVFGFDYRVSQLKHIDELIGEDKSGFVNFLRQCRQSKAAATKREIELNPDQVLKTYDCIVSCVYENNQKVCGTVAVLHDITREKEISQMKNDFVNHVSHELKTPLASITAYSEMLADGEADDEEMRKEFYGVIQSQAKRLNRLIEDILNTSRIESGLIKVDKTAVSLPILIDEQIQMIKSYAEEKDISLSWGDIDTKSKDLIVYGQAYVDKDMISQVIVNLLSNAVKYTPAGGSIKIQTCIDEESNTARVTVTDTGVGIPADEIEHVFDKFYRVGVNKKQAKGTGLGLNLVKQIVEKVHGGRVFVTSEVGSGSTFGFELPLTTAQTVQSGI